MRVREFEYREIIDEVVDLGMPRNDRAVINHGGAAVTRGLRPERPEGDIDACIDDDNWKYLVMEKGFVVTPKLVGVSNTGDPIFVDVLHDEGRRFDFHRHDFSQYLYNKTGKGRLSLDRQITMSERDKSSGLWIACEKLLFLEKLDTGRPQDEELIDIMRRFQIEG